MRRPKTSARPLLVHARFLVSLDLLGRTPMWRLRLLVRFGVTARSANVVSVGPLGPGSELQSGGIE